MKGQGFSEVDQKWWGGNVLNNLIGEDAAILLGFRSNFGLFHYLTHSGMAVVR